MTGRQVEGRVDVIVRKCSNTESVSPTIAVGDHLFIREAEPNLGTCRGSVMFGVWASRCTFAVYAAGFAEGQFKTMPSWLV